MVIVRKKQEADILRLDHPILPENVCFSHVKRLPHFFKCDSPSIFSLQRELTSAFILMFVPGSELCFCSNLFPVQKICHILSALLLELRLYCALELLCDEFLDLVCLDSCYKSLGLL